MTDEDAIELGVVVKPHGVRGEVKARLHNPASEALDDFSLGALWVELPDGVRYEVVGRRARVQAGAVLALAEVTDREAAERLRGGRLMVRREAIALDEGQYLYADLVGCVVRDGERILGRVTAVFEAGASEVLVVEPSAGGELLIPLVDDWVARIDLGAHEIHVVDAADRWADSDQPGIASTGPAGPAERT